MTADLPPISMPYPVARHAIGTAVIQFNWRGGHAVSVPLPRALRQAGISVKVRNPVTVESGGGLTIPRRPKGCVSSKMTLSPWAKRHGFKASDLVTYWCDA